MAFIYQCEECISLKPEIVNLVATSDLRQALSLPEVAKMRYTIYDQEIYGGRVVYLKTPKMQGKTSIFPSGKLISVGTRSPEGAQSDLQYTADYLFKHGLIPEIKVNAQTRNIVAMITLENLPSLEEMTDTIGAMYEPEQFPGAILRSEETNATYLIFQSGKIIISGTNSMEKLNEAVSHITRVIDESR